MIPTSLYRYVWRTSRKDQVRICLLTAVVAPLTMVPLELQRRIVDQAVGDHEIWLLALLGLIYLGVVLVQGVLKYFLNLSKGRVLEVVARDLRTRVLERSFSRNPTGTGQPSTPVEKGTLASMAVAESEDIGGFASESVAVPLLQVGTILWVLGYLIWVEPLIAALAVLIYTPQAVLVPRIQTAINRLARTRTTLVRGLGSDVVAASELSDVEDPTRRAHAGVLIERIFKTRMLIYRNKFFLTFLGNFLDSLGPIVVLTVGGYMVIRGQTEVSTLVVFISGFHRLADPWDQLINFYRFAATSRVTYGLVAEALGTERAGSSPILDYARPAQL